MTVSRRLLPGCALTISLAIPPQPSGPATPFGDLLKELATRIAGAVAPAETVQVQSVDTDAGGPRHGRPLAGDLARLLTAGGVRVTERTADQRERTAVVAFTCGENLRERVCLAEIRRGEGREVVTATQAYTRSDAALTATVPLVLELRPLLAQMTPVLDVAILGQQLLVLEPSAVTLQERTPDGWRPVSSRPIRASRPWPRDLRGRLRVEGATFEAFLPGAVCQGTIDPLSASCRDEQRAWPIGPENAGLTPARNDFLLGDGQSYYAAASLGTSAGARWIVTARDGRLLFLDDAGRPIDSAAGSGDEVAALSVACSADSHVLLSSRDAGALDRLRLVRVLDRTLLPAGAPAVLPGPLTALWSTAGHDRAIAVARDLATGRHEIFQVAVACGR